MTTNRPLSDVGHELPPRLDDAYYRPSIPKFWASAFRQETVADLERIRWRKDGGRVALHVVFLSLVGCLLALVSLLPTAVDKFPNDYCRPDGSFSVTDDTYHYFAASAAFVINISFGSYTFSQVKLIDTAWDVLIGRGGQAVCGFITYYVMTSAMTRHMESESVSRLEFEAVTIHNASFTALVIYTKYLFRRKPIRATLLTLWCLFSCAFVLAVPTWAGAMTGYTVKVRPYLAKITGDLVQVPPREFKFVYYTIHDGSRLGSTYTDNHIVVASKPPPRLPQSLESPSSDQFKGFCDGPRSVDAREAEEIDLVCAVSLYTSIYGFRGLNQTLSRFTYVKDGRPYPRISDGISIGSPVLDITAHFESPTMPLGDRKHDLRLKWLEKISPLKYPYGLSWIDPTTKSRPHLEHPDPLQRVGIDKFSYYSDELNTKGLCSAGSSLNLRYQWGFSALLLEVFLATLLLWSSGMYATYLDAFVNSRLVANGRSMGSVRALWDMSQTISTRLNSIEDAIELASDRRLKQAIDGVRLNYSAILDKHPTLTTRKSRLRQWWKQMNVITWLWREKVWLALLLLLVSVMPCQSAASPTWWPLLGPAGPALGICMVLALGPARRSRWLAFVFTSSASLILVLVLCTGGVVCSARSATRASWPN